MHDHTAGTPDLDLPDAPDFISQRTALSLEQMLPILEDYRRWFPLTDAQRAAREKGRVTAEFIL